MSQCFKKVSSGCWVEKRQKRRQGRRNQEAISVGQVRDIQWIRQRRDSEGRGRFGIYVEGQR